MEAAHIIAAEYNKVYYLIYLTLKIMEIRVKNKYAYITCIRCGKEKYRSMARYQQMLVSQTKDEIEATFVCGKCKQEEKKIK